MVSCPREILRAFDGMSHLERAHVLRPTNVIDLCVLRQCLQEERAEVRIRLERLYVQHRAACRQAMMFHDRIERIEMVIYGLNTFYAYNEAVTIWGASQEALAVGRDKLLWLRREMRSTEDIVNDLTQQVFRIISFVPEDVTAVSNGDPAQFNPRCEVRKWIVAERNKHQLWVFTGWVPPDL